MSSISAQALDTDDLKEIDKNKVLKSTSISNNSSTETKVKANTTKVKANSTNKTKENSTTVKANSTNKTKENSTIVNKKTLAKASTSFMDYVNKNGKYPKVKISNRNYSNTEYLYLITKAVENNSNSKIEIKKNLVKKYNNTKIKPVKGSLNKTEYVQIAGKVRKFIEKNKRAPNWAKSSKGNIPYDQLILSYSKCLDFFNKNNRLPNSIKLDDLDLDKTNSKLNKNKTKSTTNTSVKSTNKTSNASVKTNTNKTKTTKNSVKTNTNKTKTTKNSVKTNTSKTKNATTKTTSTKKDNSNKDTSLVERTLNNINSILNNILDKLDPSKYTVDVTKSDEANVKLNTSKINVDINGKSTVNVQVSSKNTTKKSTSGTKKTNTTKNSVKTNASNTKKTNTTKNSVKTNASSTKKTNSTKASVSKTAAKTVNLNASSINEALKKYLKSSKNCQVSNKAIKDLAKTLTSKLKTDYDKGKKLFNWVRDNIQYKKYRNTRRGAVKTLQSKKGNCVDQSHLLVALSRAAGIPARYVKGGNCKFTSGYVSGHIWTQLYINNKWVVADTTSSRNTLGRIRNWDTKNYKLYGQFSSISF